MKKVVAIVFILLVLIISTAFASETNSSHDTEYQNMSVEELQATINSLQDILNQKIIGSAKLTLSADKLDIAVNKSSKITVSCEQRKITTKTKITYNSSDESIATVSKGIIKACNEGSTTITVTATFEDGAILTTNCYVHVYIPVKKIAFTSEKTSLLSNNELNLNNSLKFAPENSTYKTVKWSVSDENIATISDDGILKPKHSGKVIVTAISTENTKTPQKAKYTVTIIEPVNSIKLNKGNFDLGNGNKITLTATVYPSTATNQKVKYYSSNDNVCTVTPSGIVTAKGTGTAVITCAATDGSNVKSSIKVTVITAVSKLSASRSEICITIGEETTARVSTVPSNPTNKKINYSSSNSNIASVDES